MSSSAGGLVPSPMLVAMLAAGNNEDEGDAMSSYASGSVGVDQQQQQQPQQPTNKQQLAVLCASVKDGHQRPPELKTLTASLAAAVPSDAEGWKLACDLLEALVARFPSESNLWGEVMNKMIIRICALEVQLAPAVFASVQKAISLFHALLHDVSDAPSRSKLKARRKAGVLSHYEMFSELRHFVGTEQDRTGQVHWMLETFQNILRIRKHNLSALLSVTGSAERCRLFGVNKADETALFYKVPARHRIVDEKTLSSSRTTFIYSLVQMVVHRVPMDIIKSQIAPTEGTGAGPAGGSSTSGSGSGTTTTSSQLTEAAVFRVCQLLETEPPRDMSSLSIEQFCDMWWGQWQNFSEELYAFVEEGLIDFGQFIMTLGKSQRQSASGRIKDNVVIWLIAQCLPLDNVKKLFLHDLTSNHGRLFLRIFEFYNSQQADAAGFELRDTALHCLIFRLYNTRDDRGRSDLKNFLPPQLQSLYERGTKAVLTYRQWWNDTEKNGENLDFYNLPWSKLWHVCLLSNFTSSPISGAFHDAMNKPLEPVQQCFLPGQLAFRGRSQPIPTIYLFLLSTRTRQRLLDLLEAHVLRPRQSPTDPYHNPAVVSTYARLLYAAPYSRNRFRLQKHLMNSEPTVLHVLLELLNFRLLRFFKYHSSVRHLYLHLHEVAMTTTHHMLYYSLENLLFKLSLNLEEVIKFSKATNVVNFGQSLNRVLILGLARQIKCRGAGSYSQLRQLPLLLARLSAVTRHDWSDSTLKYFPEVMRTFFQQNQKADPDAFAAKEMVYQEFQAQESLLRGALSEDNPMYSMNYLEHAPEACVQRLNEYYGTNVHARKLFLALVWILLRERESSNAQNVLRILQQFSPQEDTACHFALVDFVLDTLQPQQLMFLPEPASPELINQTGGLLAKLVWHYNIVRFEVLLQALMDRDGDINAFSLIDYLLNQSPEFATRAEFWCSLGVRPDHWREQAYFTHHRQYHEKFPELLAMPGTQPLPTYYSNVCLRTLPILDVLLGRFIETDQLSLFERVVNRYGQLWKYHDAPLTFVRELLHYYHESDNISAQMWKLNILSVLRGITPKFSASFQDYATTKVVEPVATDTYFRATVSHVAAFLTTELPTNNKHHTTATLQIFEEFSDVCQEAVTTTLVELLLLPFSATDVATKLLDIILGPLQDNTNKGSGGTNATAALDSFMQVEMPSESGSAMFDLLGTMDTDQAASFSYPTAPGGASGHGGSTLPTPPSTPPLTLGEISAVALLLTSLPSHFHTPVYERVMLLAQRHPLLSPTVPMDDKLPPGAGPFSCYSFTDYSSNVSSMLDNLPNRALCLLHHFFLYGSVENFAIYPNFLRALAPSSIQQLFLACKLIAPFIYRINSKPELCVEIIVELYKGLAAVLNAGSHHSRFGAEVPLDPMNYMDTVVDFLIHVVAIYEGPVDILQPSLQQVVATMPRHLQTILLSATQHLTSRTSPQAS